MESNRIKELRESRGLSQIELAEAVGRSQSALGTYERGERSPDSELIAKLADFFNVTTDYLLGKSEFRVPKEIQQHDKNLSGLKDLIDDYAARGADRLIMALSNLLGRATIYSDFVYDGEGMFIFDDFAEVFEKWEGLYYETESTSDDHNSVKTSRDGAIVRLYEVADDCRSIILRNGKALVNRSHEAKPE